MRLRLASSWGGPNRRLKDPKRLGRRFKSHLAHEEPTERGELSRGIFRLSGADHQSN
jgi:hypothetical protein